MRALIVVAKAPLRGLAKTRLARETSAAYAARVAEAMLRDTLAACARLEGVALTICFTPADEEARFRELAPGAALLAQPEGDLGTRLCAAFAHVFAAGAERALMIGADTPHLGSDRLAAALAALDSAELVLGPAEDGGYWAIGLRRALPALFRGIDWGTPRVFAQTAAAARREGVSAHFLERSFDVDELSDLHRLATWRDEGNGEFPHTARVLP